MAGYHRMSPIMACMLRLNNGPWHSHLRDVQIHWLNRRHDSNIALAKVCWWRTVVNSVLKYIFFLDYCQCTFVSDGFSNYIFPQLTPNCKHRLSKRKQIPLWCWISRCFSKLWGCPIYFQNLEIVIHHMFLFSSKTAQDPCQCERHPRLEK